MPWGGGGGSYGAVELAFLRHWAVLPFWGVDFTSLVQRNVFLHFMYLLRWSAPRQMRSTLWGGGSLGGGGAGSFVWGIRRCRLEQVPGSFVFFPNIPGEYHERTFRHRSNYISSFLVG